MEKQIEALRNEIASANNQMINGLAVLFLIIAAGYIAAVITDKPELYKLVIMMALTAVFFAARQDYMIHRPGAFIKIQEEKKARYEGMTAAEVKEKTGITMDDQWETWKDSLLSRKYLLPPLDLLAGIGVLYLLVCAQMSLWQQNPRFVIATSLMFVIGIIMIPITTVLAGK